MNKSKRILLIDDDERITFGFSKYLQHPGVDVDCAHSLEKAQHCMATYQYDAAIIDLWLSSSTEIEDFVCIRLLRACQKHCRILLLTDSEDNRLQEQAKLFNVDLFYQKHIEPRIIKKTLESFGIYTV